MPGRILAHFCFISEAPIQGVGVIVGVGVGVGVIVGVHVGVGVYVGVDVDVGVGGAVGFDVVVGLDVGVGVGVTPGVGVGVGVDVGLATSSLNIVPKPSESTRIAGADPRRFDSFTVNVSFGSNAVSPFTGTSIWNSVFVSEVNVIVPDLG